MVMLLVPFGVWKMVLIPLRVFSLSFSWAKKIWQGIMCYVRINTSYWWNKLSHTHKAGSWYLCVFFFKLFNNQPVSFYLSPPLGGKVFFQRAPRNLQGLQYPWPWWISLPCCTFVADAKIISFVFILQLYICVKGQCKISLDWSWMTMKQWVM